MNNTWRWGGGGGVRTDMDSLFKCVVLNLVKEMYQTVKTEFDQIFKHLEVCQNVPLLRMSSWVPLHL